MILALVGVGLGVALMTTLLTLSEGFNRRLNDTFAELAADVTVSSSDAPGSFGGGGGGTPFSSAYVSQIESLANVDWVYPEVLATIPPSSFGESGSFGATLSGIDITKDKLVDGPTSHIIEGDNLTNKNEVIVGVSVNSGPGPRSVVLNIGQILKVPLSSENTSLEFIELEVVGVFETGNVLFDNSLYALDSTVREIADVEEGKVHSLRVRAANTEVVEVVEKEVIAIFEKNDIDVQVILAGDALGEINDTLGIFRLVLLAIGLIASIAGGISIFIIMLMGVLERKKEFGILKAAGWSNTNILLSVVIESVTIGFLGASVGLLVGFGSTKVLEGFIGESFAVYNPIVILGIIGFGIMMGLLGGLYPAVKAARVAPIETLRAL